MVIHVDFTVKDMPLVWMGPDQLTWLVPKKRFRTPTLFYEDTLLVMISGLPVSKDHEDGFSVIGDDIIELNETLRPNAWVMVGYIQKEPS